MKETKRLTFIGVVGRYDFDDRQIILNVFTKINSYDYLCLHVCVCILENLCLYLYA